MNFGGFASKLKESANQAARTLQSFDGMAAGDDGAGRQSQPPPPPNTMGQLEMEIDSERSTLSTTIEGNQEQQQPVMGLLSVVQRTLQGSNVEPRITQQHQPSSSSRFKYRVPDDEMEDDSDDDIDDDDPIFSRMRTEGGSSRFGNGPNKKIPTKRPAWHNHADNNMKSPMQSFEVGAEDASDARKMNVHRFLQDLETRISMPVSPTFPEHPETTPAKVIVDGGPASWIKSLTHFANGSGSNGSSQSKPQAPWARQRKPSSEDDGDDDQIEDCSIVVSSSAMLDDEEMQALNRMKVTSQNAAAASTNPLKVLCLLLRENPREAFIAFTLVLATVVFFASRGLSMEDDVS